MCEGAATLQSLGLEDRKGWSALSAHQEKVMTITFDQKSTVLAQLPGIPTLVTHSSLHTVIKYLLGAGTIPNAEVKQTGRFLHNNNLHSSGQRQAEAANPTNKQQQSMMVSTMRGIKIEGGRLRAE